MPREIIHLSVGQCGNQIGNKFWETIAQEHGISAEGKYVGSDSQQLGKIDVYFHETVRSRFVPRTILVDTERSVINHISQRTYGNLFRPQNLLTSKDGAANCFMEGRYSVDSCKLCDRVMQSIRRELEGASCFSGFSYSHSSAGGTGSGLAMKIDREAESILANSYAQSWFYTVFPSQSVSNTVLEPYNTALLLEQQMGVTDVTALDNESLYSICFNTLGLANPTFGDLNRLVSMVMAGTSATFRFSGQLNTDMNKLSVSLRCRPFLHWYVPSFAPLTSVKSLRFRKLTASELVRQMTSENNQMMDCTPDSRDLALSANKDINGCCFAYAAMFRGEMSSRHVDEALAFLKGDQSVENSIRSTIGHAERSNFILGSVKSSQNYHPCNPRPTFNTITNFPAPGVPMSVTYLRNTSAVKHKFLRVLRQAKSMWNAGSYVEWYEKQSYENVEVALEDCVRKLTSEFIIEFGVEDGSNWPESLLFQEPTAGSSKYDGGAPSGTADALEEFDQ